MAQKNEIKITANEFTNVKDVKKNFLYSKDGYIFGYLRVFSYNLDLLSKEERKVKTTSISSNFEGDKSDFVYFSYPREIDLDSYKNFLKEKYTSELASPGNKRILEEMILEAVELSTNGENFEHQHFIKLFHFIKKDLHQEEVNLKARLEEFKVRYEGAGIRCEILNEIEIIKLCNLFGNSLQASYENVDDNTVYTPIMQLGR